MTCAWYCILVTRRFKKCIRVLAVQYAKHEIGGLCAQCRTRGNKKKGENWQAKSRGVEATVFLLRAINFPRVVFSYFRVVLEYLPTYEVHRGQGHCFFFMHRILRISLDPVRTNHPPYHLRVWIEYLPGSRKACHR
jgi:hypothetical protein